MAEHRARHLRRPQRQRLDHRQRRRRHEHPEVLARRASSCCRSASTARAAAATTRATSTAPAGIAVHAPTNEVFVADGYGNRRVIVFDATTGAYKRHWGAYGNKPDDAAPFTRIYEGPRPAAVQHRARHCAYRTTASSTSAIASTTASRSFQSRRHLRQGGVHRAADHGPIRHRLRRGVLPRRRAALFLRARRHEQEGADRRPALDESSATSAATAATESASSRTSTASRPTPAATSTSAKSTRAGGSIAGFRRAEQRAAWIFGE